MRQAIPGYDEFGNPVDQGFDLGGGDEERVRGERILFYVPGPDWYGHEWHLAQQAVAERGFSMDIVYPRRRSRCPLTGRMLEAYSQLWFVSDKRATLAAGQVRLIRSYVEGGNGLLIWADNDPFFADANELARRILGTMFSGDKPGERVLVPGETLTPGRFVEHPLTQGINRLHEGHTISTITPGEHITILAQSHDGQYCMACSERGDQRVVLDTGFTKLMNGRFYKTPGTARYFRNIAFWLARGARDYQYNRFTPGHERLATIDPGGVSERYVYDVAQPTLLTYILHWSGQATLGILIQDPQGRMVQDTASPSPPIRLEIPAGATGPWSCWVKGVNVPRAGFSYVLTLAVKRSGGRQARPAGVRQAPHAAQMAPVATRRLPIYVLLDASRAASDAAPALETGLDTLTERLRARGSRRVEAAMSVSVVGAARPRTVPLTEASGFSVPPLHARGTLRLGLALRELLRSLAQVRSSTDSRPLIVILLANLPDDDWTAQAEQLRRLAEQRQANVFAVALGDFADADQLSRLSPVGPLVLRSVAPSNVERFFDWVYQVADAMMGGLERSTEGGSLSVPPLPACVTVLQ